MNISNAIFNEIYLGYIFLVEYSYMNIIWRFIGELFTLANVKCSNAFIISKELFKTADIA